LTNKIRKIPTLIPFKSYDFAKATQYGRPGPPAITNPPQSGDCRSQYDEIEGAYPRVYMNAIHEISSYYN